MIDAALIFLSTAPVSFNFCAIAFSLLPFKTRLDNQIVKQSMIMTSNFVPIPFNNNPKSFGFSKVCQWLGLDFLWRLMRLRISLSRPRQIGRASGGGRGE